MTDSWRTTPFLETEMARGQDTHKILRVMVVGMVGIVTVCACVVCACVCGGGGGLRVCTRLLGAHVLQLSLLYCPFTPG